MTDYKQAYERLVAAAKDVADYWDGPTANFEESEMDARTETLRHVLHAPLPLREVPSPSAKPETLAECWQTIEYLDVEIAGAVDDLRRAHRFDPDAVSALLVLIEEAHVRQWTALKLAVKRVRASERRPKA